VRTYLQEEILHLRYSTDDGFLGRSPITICREALGLGLAQQRHGASIMKDGMMAAGVVTTAEWLDSVKGKRLWMRWSATKVPECRENADP
jgi:phage portal protein BeeE